jgi:hypothetical protein
VVFGVKKIGSNPENMKHLADGIRDNSTITKLSLGDNNIGSNPDDMKYIEEIQQK